MPEVENLSTTMPQAHIDLGSSQVITATGVFFNHVDEGFPMWNGDGDRTVRAEIKFMRSFGAVPVMQAGITGIDCAQDRNLRYWLKIVDIKTFGFTLEFNTWGDTNIARAGVSWMAVGR